MLEEQQLLEARYAALRDSRTGPVFFIEHGLSVAETGDLSAAVRAAIEVRPLDSDWWDAHKLPFIVAATEVGYSYRGAGTDFWPRLEEEIGARFGGTTRQRVRNLFAIAASVFRGAQPPATPWAQAFHLIAWPITHALVPLEFHRALALALANLRVNVAELDDESLYRAIRIAAASPTARFSTLLESRSLVVSVVRGLLGIDSVELCPEVIQRITGDLASDHLARRSLTAARRVQRVAPKGRRDRGRGAEAVPSISGTLQLRRRDKVLVLEASFPPIESQISSRLRRALRRRRFAPKLWGATTRIPSEQLLSGLPFTVKFVSEPANGAALLPNLESLDIEPDLREILEAFELQLQSSHLFAVGTDKETASQIRGPSISGHREYWLLTSSRSSLLKECPTLGEISPYTCYYLDPVNDVHSHILAQFGYIPRFGISVAFAGAPPLNRDAPIPAFIEGDQRIVVPRHSHPDDLLVEVNGHRTQVAVNEIVRVLVPTGEHLLRVRSGAESREFAFRGVPASAPSAPAASVIDLQSSELTVEALMNGSLAFSIDSFAPLEQLEFTVEFETAGSRLSASIPIGPLPQVITSKQEPFATLMDDATREVLQKTLNPVLHLRLGNVCARDWTLERRVRSCWWVRGSEERIALRSESGEVSYGMVVATEPHLPPTACVDPSDKEASLLVPVGLDGAEYGPATFFTTLCIAPDSISFNPPVIRRPHLQRRRRAGSGAAGLEDLAEAFLRWSLAESDTVTAEIRRQQVTHKIDGWMIEICCGHTWRDLESEISSNHPWDLLVDIGDNVSLGRDSYLSLPDEVWRESLELAVVTIRHEIPDLWSLARPPSELVSHDWDMVCAACDNAHKNLSCRYQAIGNTEIAGALAEADASADFDPDAWQSVLEAVLAQTDLTALAALLLPSDSASRFMALDPSRMSLDDLGEELYRWARDSQKAFAGDLPDQETLRTIVAFWTEPEVAVHLDWRRALDTIISERSIARAARYLALRSRQARRESAT